MFSVKKQSGFTLVELSIVLVIIGLIVGGIVGGQALIKSASRLKVVAEHRVFQTAFNSFQLQYDYLPGDMPNATDYGWSISPGTLNGDGNNIITAAGHGSVTEMRSFWHQLEFAELVSLPNKGGLYGNSWPYAANGEDNWLMVSQLPSLGTTTSYGAMPNKHTLILTKETSGGDRRGALTPEDAHFIDKKIDDGNPGGGKVWARNVHSASHGACVNASNWNASSIPTQYYVSEPDETCLLFFIVD